MVAAAKERRVFLVKVKTGSVLELITQRFSDGLLYAACETVLSPCFKQNDGDGIGKIHAPAVGHHRQADFLSGRQAVENFGWQAARFGTKQQHVAFAEGNFVGAGRAFGGQRENAAAFECLEAIIEILMYRQFGKLVIIQARAFHFGRIQRETKRLDQVQIGTGIGAQADDIARIRRDFRLVQNYGKHINQSLIEWHNAEMFHGCQKV